MNCIGVLVDLSHTFDATASEAKRYPKTPVIWSHSSARGIHYRERDVPDEVLELTATDGGKDGAVVLECIFPNEFPPTFSH